MRTKRAVDRWDSELFKNCFKAESTPALPSLMHALGAGIITHIARYAVAHPTQWAAKEIRAMSDGYSLTVRQSVKLLETVFEIFQGNARISLEGDLSLYDLRRIPVVANDSVGNLHRNTLQPQLDFVVLPLEANTLDLIKRHILQRVGIHHRVIHIQVEKGGKLVFAAYDNFQPDSVWISSDVSEDFLEALVESTIIKSYHVVQV